MVPYTTTIHNMWGYENHYGYPMFVIARIVMYDVFKHLRVNVVLEWVASKHLENATKTQVGFP